MVYVSTFTSLAGPDTRTAGGKGASLSEMAQAGIAIPPGFTVLTSAFDTFLEAAGLRSKIEALLKAVDHQAIETLELASKEIQTLILEEEIPPEMATAILAAVTRLDSEYLAVRSSASVEDGSNATWAGQLESYLNVSKPDVLEKLKHCWSSLFTVRALFYRFENNFHHEHISVAVVVQQMVASEVSGIAFSVHPVSEDANQLIIEAGYGLGEAIVSGEITPDSYVVQKNDRQILTKQVTQQRQGLFRARAGGNEWRDIAAALQEKQKLDDGQILDLATIVTNIERHYGFPVDVEWALTQQKFSILQSRPITTLSPKTSEGKSALYKQ